MPHIPKRWALPCLADEVGSESLKPFEGLRAALTALQLRLGKPACSPVQQTSWRSHEKWLDSDVDTRMKHSIVPSYDRSENTENKMFETWAFAWLIWFNISDIITELMRQWKEKNQLSLLNCSWSIGCEASDIIRTVTTLSVPVTQTIKTEAKLFKRKHKQCYSSWDANMLKANMKLCST